MKRTQFLFDPWLLITRDGSATCPHGHLCNAVQRGPHSPDRHANQQAAATRQEARKSSRTWFRLANRSGLREHEAVLSEHQNSIPPPVVVKRSRLRRYV